MALASDNEIWNVMHWNQGATPIDGALDSDLEVATLVGMYVPLGEAVVSAAVEHLVELIRNLMLVGDELVSYLTILRNDELVDKYE
jgi:hypothetical protein